MALFQSLAGIQTTEGISRFFASLIFGTLWQLVSPTVAFLFGAGMAVVAAFLMMATCKQFTYTLWLLETKDSSTTIQTHGTNQSSERLTKPAHSTNY